MIEHKELAALPERFPLACQWEITCRCNLRCVMCYTDCFNRPDLIRNELSTSEILRIMDELAAAGCLDLVLTGGEPLARPDFFDIYERAKENGFLTTLFTNGTLITETVAHRLALSESARLRLMHDDPDLWAEACRQQSQDPKPCESGKRRFHIDAYGGLQLCSGNRQMSYDLRTGTFEEGFYHALPSFPCAWKIETPMSLARPRANHA